MRSALLATYKVSRDVRGRDTDVCCVLGEVASRSDIQSAVLCRSIMSAGTRCRCPGLEDVRGSNAWQAEEPSPLRHAELSIRPCQIKA
jgi:hypothetical protein